MYTETSIDIDAPPERVWQVMSDVERWPEWTPTVYKVEKLQPGPLAVGQEARIAQPKFGTRVWRVTSVEDGRSFAWESKSPGTRLVGSHTITPGRDGGSTVTLGVDSSGWAVRLFGWLLAGTGRRFVQTEADSLKRRSESAV